MVAVVTGSSLVGENVTVTGSFVESCRTNFSGSPAAAQSTVTLPGASARDSGFGSATGSPSD